MFQKTQAPNLKPRNLNENLWCEAIGARIFWNIFGSKYDCISGVFFCESGCIQARFDDFAVNFLLMSRDLFDVFKRSLVIECLQNAGGNCKSARFFEPSWYISQWVDQLKDVIEP
jgi:hypothetical protein